eukprot:6456820-Amphidinium_carterae.1
MSQDSMSGSAKWFHGSPESLRHDLALLLGLCGYELLSAVLGANTTAPVSDVLAVVDVVKVLVVEQEKVLVVRVLEVVWATLIGPALVDVLVLDDAAEVLVVDVAEVLVVRALEVVWEAVALDVLVVDDVLVLVALALEVVRHTLVSLLVVPVVLGHDGLPDVVDAKLLVVLVVVLPDVLLVVVVCLVADVAVLIVGTLHAMPGLLAVSPACCRGSPRVHTSAECADLHASFCIVLCCCALVLVVMYAGVISVQLLVLVVVDVGLVNVALVVIIGTLRALPMLLS